MIVLPPSSPPPRPAPPILTLRIVVLLLLLSCAFFSLSASAENVVSSSFNPANPVDRRARSSTQLSTVVALAPRRRAAAAAAVASSSIAASSSNPSGRVGPPAERRSLSLLLRGGGDDDDGGGGGIAKKKRKKRRRKREGGRGEVDDENYEDEKREGGRRAINVAMKEADAASALGDAIRDRGDVLRSDKLDDPTSSSAVGRIDASLSSLGWSLGTSDSYSSRFPPLEGGGRDRDDKEDEEEGGGVSASPGAVIANYFLRSHGGLHGVQSIASALSVLFGISALLVPSPSSSSPPSSDLKLTLIRRCLQCALAKHVAGLFAVASASARGVKDYGFVEARRRLERSARDPVAQYSFYCALMLIWTAGVGSGGETTTAAAAAAVASGATTATGEGSTEATKGGEATSPATGAATGGGGVEGAVVAAAPWWLSAANDGGAFGRSLPGKLAVPAILGPILLREIVSTAWTISDVSVLLATTTSSSSSKGGRRDPIALRVARSTVDAVLSLLFTPAEWRTSDGAKRQRLLANLVSKSSVGFELIVFVVLTYDAIRAFLDYALSPVAKRPELGSTVKRVFVARLYWNFVMARRRKVGELVGTVRGGASAVPGRVLDALLEPRKAMGLLLDDNADGGGGDDDRGRRAVAEGTRDGNHPRGKWSDVVSAVLGFDE